MTGSLARVDGHTAPTGKAPANSNPRRADLNGYAVGVGFAAGDAASVEYERADQLARELGEFVAGDPEGFAVVAPLVVSNEQGRQWVFCEGLAAGTDSIDACWGALALALVLAFESTPDQLTGPSLRVNLPVE